MNGSYLWRLGASCLLLIFCMKISVSRERRVFDLNFGSRFVCGFVDASDLGVCCEVLNLMSFQSEVIDCT